MQSFRDPSQRPTEPGLDLGDELVEAPGVEQILEARLAAVGAITVVDEDADDGVGDLRRLFRLHIEPGRPREILVAGNAAEQQSEPDAGIDAGAVHHLDGREADIVGVLERGDASSAVECDIELAGQAEQRARVEHVEMPVTGVGPRVDQLLRVDPCRWRAGDIAHIVGARAAGDQPQVLDRLDQ